MTITLEHITNELVDSYRSLLSNITQTNIKLNHINNRKSQYTDLTKGLHKLSSLLNQITWIDHLDSTEEVLIKGLIAIGKESHEKFRKYYASERRAFVPKGWFKEEFKSWKQALELHRETLLEIEHIIFDLRKNLDFNNVCDLLNDL